MQDTKAQLTEDEVVRLLAHRDRVEQSETAVRRAEIALQRAKIDAAEAAVDGQELAARILRAHGLDGARWQIATHPETGAAEFEERKG